MTRSSDSIRRIIPPTEDRLPLIAAGGVVFAHVGVNTAHGIAHAEIPVVVTDLQTVFIAVVMFAAPLVALGLIATGHQWTGGTVLAVSMASALVFGLVFHYVLSTSDNVAAVPADPWQGSFRLTAALLVLVDAAGVVIGAWLMRRKWLSATTI
jgi:hypothetical protein